MGFDPMTHRPRTDIFATLPQLLALANLIENPSPASWEDHAIRMQSEALQMARLNQCLQHLLRPSIQIPNFHGAGTVSDVDAAILAHLEAPPPPAAAAFSAAQFLQDSAQFAHLPELQAAPCGGGDFAGVMGQLENSPPSSSPWMQQSLSASPVAAQVAESSVIDNTVDVCGGAAQMWSELLDDPIFLDIA